MPRRRKQQKKELTKDDPLGIGVGLKKPEPKPIEKQFEPPKKVGLQAATTSDSWEPKPAVKSESEVNNPCTNCQHLNDKHYGQGRNWCNVNGCECMDFKTY